MAAPPSGRDADEPDAVAFGIAAVEAELESNDVTFPADAVEILQAIGDPDVPYDPWGDSIELSSAIDATGKQSFDSRREFLNALHPVFEAKRDGGGLSGWLRSLLPL